MAGWRLRLPSPQRTSYILNVSLTEEDVRLTWHQNFCYCRPAIFALRNNPEVDRKRIQCKSIRGGGVDHKLVLGVLSVEISVFAYAIYLWQTAKKEGVQPH